MQKKTSPRLSTEPSDLFELDAAFQINKCKQAKTHLPIAESKPIVPMKSKSQEKKFSSNRPSLIPSPVKKSNYSPTKQFTAFQKITKERQERMKQFTYNSQQK